MGPLQPLPVRTPASQRLVAAAFRTALSVTIPQISRYTLHPQLHSMACAARVHFSHEWGDRRSWRLRLFKFEMHEGLCASVKIVLCRETGRWQTWRPICRPECSTSNSRAIVSRCQTLSWVISADLAPSLSMVRPCALSSVSLRPSPC